MKILKKQTVTKFSKKNYCSRMSAVIILANRRDNENYPIYDCTSLPVWGKCPDDNMTDLWSWDESSDEAIINNLEEIVDYDYFIAA